MRANSEAHLRTFPIRARDAAKANASVADLVRLSPVEGMARTARAGVR
jgi:hypothetical protein